jgi:RNA polymerase primary sigma factor
MAEFRFERVQDLLRQLLVSPPEVREKNADRLEALLLELEPERVYPYEFLYFRITGFRPSEDVRDTFRGADVLPDLLRVLTELSDTVPRNVLDVDEEVLTLTGVAAERGVSVRTVRRWRDRGLASRSYYFADGRLKAGVRRSALERFVRLNEDSVESSRQFSRLTAVEEERALGMARRLAQEGDLSLTAAAGRVAAELGRAVETVRQVLVRHDEEHSGEAVFGVPAGRIDEDARRRIVEEHRRGVPVEDLCEAYGRSRASIYRILNQERAAEILAEDMDYCFDPSFEEADAGAAILSEALRELLGRLRSSGGPDWGAGNEGKPFQWQRSPLTREEETALFRAYNFAKWRGDQMRNALNPRRYVAAGDLARIDEVWALARTIREVLLRMHTPLAVHIAAEQSRTGGDPEELAATAIARLGPLIDSFGWNGRARFPSYANLELLKWFALHTATPTDRA